MKSWDFTGIRIFFPLLIHTALVVLCERTLAGLSWPGGAGMVWAVSAGNLASWVVLIWICKRKGRLRRMRETPGTARNGEERTGKSGFLLLFWFVLGAVCSVTAAKLMRMAGLYRLFSNEVQEEFLQAPVLLQIFGLGIISPAAEELAYRDLFFCRTREFLSFWQAAVLSALLFALGHGNPIQAIYAFFMGLILAGIAQKSGYGGAFCFHAGANLISVFLTAGLP